jgi:cytochrome c oxidase cbb3-type subunit 2
MFLFNRFRILGEVIAVLAAWGAFTYLSHGKGTAHSPPTNAAGALPGAEEARGQKLYIANCSACHQVSGEGLAGVFPPLKGSGVVNKDDATKHMHVILDGIQGGKAGGVVYAAAMPPFAGTLSDADIAGIIDYERSSWGNHGRPVTTAQVAAERSSSH